MRQVRQEGVELAFPRWTPVRLGKVSQMCPFNVSPELVLPCPRSRGRTERQGRWIELALFLLPFLRGGGLGGLGPLGSSGGCVTSGCVGGEVK